jgi:hypothetical protein
MGKRRPVQVPVVDRRYGASTDPGICSSTPPLVQGAVAVASRRVLAAPLEGFQQVDALLALQLELAERFLQGTVGLGGRAVVAACGIVLVDALKGALPRSQRFGLVVLCASTSAWLSAVAGKGQSGAFQGLSTGRGPHLAFKVDGRRAREEALIVRLL